MTVLWISIAESSGHHFGGVMEFLYPSRFCFFPYPSRSYARTLAPRDSWVLPVLKDSSVILAALWTWQLLHFALDLTISGFWESLHFSGYRSRGWDWILYKKIDFSVSQIWLQILAVSLYSFTHAFTARKLLLMPRGTYLAWTDTLNPRSKYSMSPWHLKHS